MLAPKVYCNLHSSVSLDLNLIDSGSLQRIFRKRRCSVRRHLLSFFLDENHLIYSYTLEMLRTFFEGVPASFIDGYLKQVQFILAFSSKQIGLILALHKAFPYQKGPREL